MAPVYHDSYRVCPDRYVFLVNGIMGILCPGKKVARTYCTFPESDFVHPDLLDRSESTCGMVANNYLCLFFQYSMGTFSMDCSK